MADLQFTLRGAEIAAVAATAKTICRVSAPANQRLKLLGWGVYFDGTSSSNQPVVVQLVRPTSDGTMSAATLIKKDSGQGETIQSSGAVNATAEPSIGDIIQDVNIHPQSGYEKTYGLGQEVIVPGGGRLGIRVTAPETVNVIPYMDFEE